MKLGEYRGKRKFKKTPEPFGKKKGPRGELRFVVQKHAASRLHYDFRLELDGVLKSWAVPKGPSLNPLDQRLAVHVEDHPLDYGDFEGTIPRGNYGAGKVEIWDRGTYRERNSQTRAESELALRKGFAEGKLTILLEGGKLRGEFALVRLKGRDPRHWLLLKKRDASAHFRYSIDEEPKPRARGKKAPTGLRPALPTKGALPTEKGWLYEEAGEGKRALAEISDGKVKLPGASPEILAKLARLPDCILDGELVSRSGKLRYEAFDLLYIQGEDLRGEPLLRRKRRLRSLPLFGSLVRYRPHRLYPPRRGTWVARRLDSPYPAKGKSGWILAEGATSTDRFADKPPLTHPDKIYFPDDGYTKADLARYYESVAPYLLPYLVDRPLSLHRQPNGIRDEGFYQKDMSGFHPRRLRTERVFSASSDRTIQYVVCQDTWSLLYLANLGCIELHPWLSRVGRLEKPDYSVIDLDPDGNQFSDVVKVALETRKVLDSIGALSFCKTSGASGIHILVPTGGRFGYDENRALAEAVCREVHRRFPTLTSVERNPARRRGKIYLDFLQNRRGQTLASAYCIRPFPGAPVSMPLEWKELTSRLNPRDFTIKNALSRLRKKGDVWAELGRETVDPLKCLAKLAEKTSGVSRWEKVSPSPKPKKARSSRPVRPARKRRKPATH